MPKMVFTLNFEFLLQRDKEYRAKISNLYSYLYVLQAYMTMNPKSQAENSTYLS
jgi:hypothetical protein